MADILCPECGARTVLGGEGRLFCQGKSDVTDQAVLDAERALKLAVASGDETKLPDSKWRTLSAQRVCGLIFSQDELTGNWKRVVPNPGS